MPITIIENHERLLEHAEATLELQRRGIEKACKEWVASHRAGPMYWLRKMTATENYHWREQGLQPVMPFPYRPFLDRKIDLSAFPFDHEFTELRMGRWHCDHRQRNHQRPCERRRARAASQS